MHMSLTPTHDRRRGSSQYRSAPGYAEADAIEDRLARQAALDALRHAVNRAERPEGVPTAHQAASILADVVGLALHDPLIKDVLQSRLGEHLRRATLARRLDPTHPMTRRVLMRRMVPNMGVEDIEREERIRAEIAASRGRRQVTFQETMAAFDALGEELEDEAY